MTIINSKMKNFSKIAKILYYLMKLLNLNLKKYENKLSDNLIFEFSSVISIVNKHSN